MPRTIDGSAQRGRACRPLEPRRTPDLRFDLAHEAGVGLDLELLAMSLTRDIDTDSSRRALAKGLIAFAQEVGSPGSPPRVSRPRPSSPRCGPSASTRRRGAS